VNVRRSRSKTAQWLLSIFVLTALHNHNLEGETKETALRSAQTDAPPINTLPVEDLEWQGREWLHDWRIAQDWATTITRRKIVA
jgi:hypothetical protein